MSRSAIVVESPTLDECRQQAARELGVSAEKLVVRVVQQGKRGVFSSKPYRIRASVRGNGSPKAKDAGSAFLSKLDMHVNLALIEMERIEVFKDSDGVFNQLLTSCEELSEERRKEVLELSKLLTGPSARKIQEKVAKDGWFKLTVSEDQFGAFVEVWPPEGIGRPVAVRDVLQRMNEEGVSHGSDHVKLRKLLEEVATLGKPLKNVRVAEGRPAESGKDGFIDFLVDPSHKEKVVRKDGSVDHRGLASVTMVHAGQVLARLIAHTEGEPGVTVRGNEIKPQPGKPARLEAGDNIDFDAESMEYRADVDGVLESIDGRIYVQQTFVVPGDVDMTIGNIEFNGTVQIMGSVRDGFSVRAAEDIEIQGGVEGCEVISEKGSVRVKQGVAGRHRCFISAGKDVEAKYIENAKVYARNDVKVSVAVMHSEVVAGNAVVAISGKGAVIGGITKAGNLVHAKALGATNEPVTEFVVGITVQDQDRIREMDGQLVGLANTVLRVEEVIKEFEHAAKNVDDLPPRDKQQYVDMRKRLLVLHCEIDKAEAKRKEFVKMATAENKGEVKAASDVFGRVLVRIGQFMDHVDTHLHTTTFRADAEQGHIVRNR